MRSKSRSNGAKDKFPVIPLSLNETKLGVLEEFFAEEPIYIPVSSDAGGVEAAMNAILVALGKRLASDVAATPQPKAESLEDLLLELTDLKFHEQDGIRRASARARLVYEPAAEGQREVKSEEQWRFIAPIGPIEAEELRWYLEKYAIWPSHYFSDRARKVEENLAKWGTTRSVTSGVNFENVPPGAMEPGDNNDFVAHLHSVEGLSVRRQHFDKGIGRTFETLQRRFVATF